jgi:hypothetical protein
VSAILTGSGEEGLNVAIREHFNPGDALRLEVSLPRMLTESEVQKLYSELSSRGIDVLSVQSEGSKLMVEFINPPNVRGYSFAWLPVLAILTGLGVTGYLTWQVGKIPESISQNILPVTAMVLGAAVLIAYLLSRKK